MRYTFPTPTPTSLYVEIGAGSVRVDATETSETEVLVEGKDADNVVVEQRGDEIVVKELRRRAGFLSFGSDLTVHVTLPPDSELTTKLGSGDLVGTGRFGAAHVRSGSGDVTLEQLTREAVVQTGSGDARIESSLGDLRVKSGSGSVQVGRVEGTTAIVSGSGRITVDSASDETVAKTGSGDVRIRETDSSVSITSGSGDLEVGTISRGAVKAKSASGSVLVGVPAGVPVWTDISTVTGSIRSNLEGAGPAEDDQDHIEIRASTVSGDVTLSQL
jgi:DUF4097 and DUF4098 domain-containing protein YvlB